MNYDIENYLKDKLIKCDISAQYQVERVCKSCIQNAGKINGKIVCCKELYKNDKINK